MVIPAELPAGPCPRWRALKRLTNKVINGLIRESRRTLPAMEGTETPLVIGERLDGRDDPAGPCPRWRALKQITPSTAGIRKKPTRRTLPAMEGTETSADDRGATKDGGAEGGDPQDPARDGGH